MAADIDSVGRTGKSSHEVFRMFPQEKSPNPFAVVSMFSSFVCLLRGYTGAPSRAILPYEIGRRFVSVFRLNQDKVVHVAPRSYLYQP